MTPDEQTALDIMAGTDANVPIVDPRTVPVRFSNLKMMSKSPMHYWQAVQRGWDPSLSQRVGTGTHALLFNQPWTVWTGSGNGKKPVRNGGPWDAFRRANADKCIMSIGEYRKSRAISEAIKRKERAMELLTGTGTVREQQVAWKCLDRNCSSRPDVRAPGYVVDLKTDKCAEPSRFARTGRWYGYHAQLAFYLDAVVASGLGTPDKAYIVVVESAPPYPVTVLRLTERAIDIGRRMCRLWLEQVLACEDEEYWPGYLESDAEFDIPDEEGLELNIGGETVRLGGEANDNEPSGLVEEVDLETEEELF